MKTVFAAFLLAMLCGCAAAPEPSPAPAPALASANAEESDSSAKALPARERVQAFLAAYQALVFRGLPDAEQAAALAEHFSPRLNGLMHDALAGQQAYKARYPSDKPPMIDGDVFSSLFEESGDAARVRVDYVYSDPDTGKVIEAWKDRFLLVRSGSGWVIDDVEYLGGWDFSPKGKLSAALVETAALRE